MSRPAFEDVIAAAERIKGVAHLTPVLTSRAMNGLSGAELFFKAENFQKTGAFKFRGALNAVASLSEAQLAKGVVTFSSGNHGAALALAAGMRGAKAQVAIPFNTPRAKQRAMAGYGAELSFYEIGRENRIALIDKLLAETGGEFIHPFNHFKVQAGQGTACLELLEQAPNLDAIIAPVGGGGLISGTAIAARGINPKLRIIGAEPAWSDFGRRSLDAGRVVASDFPPTMADGLKGGPSETTLPIIVDLVERIIAVSEEEIASAMRMIFERMKLVVEPSAAVALAAVQAAIRAGEADLAGKRLGLILTGGNVDLDKLPWAVKPV